MDSGNEFKKHNGMTPELIIETFILTVLSVRTND